MKSKRMYQEWIKWQEQDSIDATLVSWLKILKFIRITPMKQYLDIQKIESIIDEAS